jgi:hypothetical protein
MSPQNLTLVNSIIEKDTSGGFVPERTLLLLLQPQPEQQPTPSFAGINKSDGSPGGITVIVTKFFCLFSLSCYFSSSSDSRSSYKNQRRKGEGKTQKKNQTRYFNSLLVSPIN